jgi:hypothetical protein
MERCGFFDARLVDGEFDRTYLATHFASYFASFVGNGVFAGKAQQLQVLANNPNSMSVKVLPGQGWINGYWYENVEEKILPVDPADGVLKRIDNVVLRLDFKERKVEAIIVKGENSGSPISPRLKRDTDAFELLLATINVGASISKISQPNISDERPNSSVCGWVTGLINQVSTQDLYEQYQAYYLEFKGKSTEEWNNLKESKKSEFEDWFNEIKAQLSGNIAGNLQTQISNLVARADNIESKNNIQDSSISDLKSKMLSVEQFVNNRSILAFSDILISQSLIQEVYDMPLYKYGIKVFLAGCTANHVPNVYFENCVFFSDVVKSFDGFIMLYTNDKNFGSVTLKRVVLKKGE